MTNTPDSIQDLKAAWQEAREARDMANARLREAKIEAMGRETDEVETAEEECVAAEEAADRALAALLAREDRG